MGYMGLILKSTTIHQYRHVSKAYNPNRSVGVITSMIIQTSHTWLDEVVGRGRDSKPIGHVRRAEIVHFIVENDSSRSGHDFGPKAGELISEKYKFDNDK